MAMIQMTPEELHQLIEDVRNASIASVAPQGKTNSIGDCSVRFWGARDHNEVDEFITTVQTYKEIENISDVKALKGISLLFSGLASTWWQGVRKEAKTWNDAMELIRVHFSPQKQPNQIYMELFEDKQAASKSIDYFVSEKRALLAQLPDGRHDEVAQLDLIYGLLNIKYRKRIPRDDVKSFKELLDKGRIIEQTVDESKEESEEESEQGTKAAASTTTAVRRSAPAGKRCTHCNFRGHTVADCRKRKAK